MTETIIDAITKEIERDLESEAYLSALALTLTIPDICTTSIYGKHSKKQYVDWYNQYIGQYENPQNLIDKLYLINDIESKIDETIPYLDGEVVYKLRCYMFHEGLSKTKEDLVTNFVINTHQGDEKEIDTSRTCGAIHFKLKDNNSNNENMCEYWSSKETTYEISIFRFCKIMCVVAKSFCKENKDKIKKEYLYVKEKGKIWVKKIEKEKRKMSETKELTQILWNGANVLRGKMDANEYKTYLLGLVFYKYLSDQYLAKAYNLITDEDADNLEEALKTYEEVCASEDKEELLAELKDEVHYTLEPSQTFTRLVKNVADNKFIREDLQRGFNQVESSDEIFEGLFADVDLYSTRLGTGDTKQSATVAELITVLAEADLIHAKGDVLGNAYEYMIGQFASETGKKAGEFYTPTAVSQLLSRLTMIGKEDKKELQIYDPCMGSGSLLLHCKNYTKYPELIQYYGQELMPSTYNLARMNMFLHHVQPENQHLRNGDTLDEDWPVGEETQFDVVAMNPPYSQAWTAKEGFLQDERFSDYGVLAPKSKADYAFLLHGFYHLRHDGTMAIVLPHGVLFRGASEGKIREKLLKDGSIYAVIGLAPNQFYNTSISTCIIVLKKQREGRDVLFIDASKQFVKEGKKNEMKDEHVDHVVQLYKDRTDVDKEAHLASYEEIVSNDFNLNIPRYVDSSEKEPPVNLKAVLEDMESIDKDIESTQNSLIGMIKEMNADEETKSLLGKLESILNGDYHE